MAPPAMMMKAALRHRFYGAVVFLAALTEAYANNRQTNRSLDRDSAQGPSPRAPAACFQDFVNTLSLFCDVKPGGDSVTAFTVLDRQDHYEFRFACNKLNKSRLDKVTEHVTDLLKTLGHVRPDDDDSFQSLILAKGLSFCRNRVHYYLGAFTKACRACTAAIQPANSKLLEQIQCVQKASSAADYKGMEEDQWVSRYKALTKIIENCCKMPNNIFAERTPGPLNPGSNCWSELRHYAGRLRSYVQGTRTLIAAAQQFPMLFDNFKVTPVMSSKPDQNPIQKTMPADKILNTMVKNSAEAAKRIAFFGKSRSLDDVHDRIEEMMVDETFKPIVHAELLVLQSLERQKLTNPSFFFNSWKYIGSSKPTCWLCDLYFAAHHGGFQVRSTHGNLYINWKPPDVVLQIDGEGAAKARDDMLNTIVHPIRKEVLRILDDQIPIGRLHDSSTGMTLPIRALSSLRSDSGRSGVNANAEDMVTWYGD